MSDSVSKVHCFRLCCGPGLFTHIYFILHEVTCTHFKMHLDYLTNVVDLTEVYSKRGLIALGGD